MKPAAFAAEISATCRPFAGAWIETGVEDEAWEAIKSPLRGGVD